MKLNKEDYARNFCNDFIFVDTLETQQKKNEHILTF